MPRASKGNGSGTVVPFDPEADDDFEIPDTRQLPVKPGAQVSRRATRFTPKKKARYLELLRKGQRRSAAAEAIGLRRQTIAAHRNADPEFAKLEELAELDANEQIEDALFQAAVSGNMTAIIFWLTNRSPGRWADRRNVAVMSPSGGPVQVQVEDGLDAEIRRLADELAGVADRSESAAASNTIPTPILD